MFSRYLMIGMLAAGLFACSGNGNHKAGVGDIEKNTATPENPNGKKTGPPGTPQFDQTVHNFGRITDGEEVQHKFKFKNIGKGELIIKNVQASCGCTTPEWSKDVIAAGGEGYVMATFNSTGKGGPDGPQVTKSITVTFENSTVETIELQFVSNIITKESK